MDAAATTVAAARVSVEQIIERVSNAGVRGRLRALVRSDEWSDGVDFAGEAIRIMSPIAFGDRWGAQRDIAALLISMHAARVRRLAFEAGRAHERGLIERASHEVGSLEVFRAQLAGGLDHAEPLPEMAVCAGGE